MSLPDPRERPTEVVNGQTTETNDIVIPESLLIKIASFGRLDSIQKFVLHRFKVGKIQICSPNRLLRWKQFLTKNPRSATRVRRLLLRLEFTNRSTGGNSQIHLL